MCESRASVNQYENQVLLRIRARAGRALEDVGRSFSSGLFALVAYVPEAVVEGQDAHAFLRTTA
jgi:hypothetical protein